jgi:hypothetical protein
MGLVDRELGNKPFGRSRDSRTWELYCDPDARSALSPASSSQNFTTGRTPSLVRSRSQRSSTLSSFCPQNILVSRSSNQLLVHGKPGDRRKLSRTVSSLGRLESGAENKATELLKKGLLNPDGSKNGVEDTELQPGDSDKENWIPGTQASNVRRRRVKIRAGHNALREVGAGNRGSDGSQKQPFSYPFTRPSGDLPRNEDGTVLPTKLDEEVFLSRSGQSSWDEDLDCIQGLLSLSQGAWR